MHLVVRMKLAGVLANVVRPEPGPRAEAGAGVEGHPENCDVSAPDVLDAGEQRKRGETGVARHRWVVASARCPDG